METSPRDSPLHSATCGMEDTENDTFRPKSAKGRRRHTPQQQASTADPSCRLLNHHQDDQQDRHSLTVDCPGTRTPVVRPKSAMGRRKPSQQTSSGKQNQTLTTDDPREVQASTKPPYLFRDGDDRETKRDTIGETNRQTGKEKVTSRQISSPVFDQVNPEVRGQSRRPKSSKGRPRHPVQPQPCVQREPSNPKSQNTDKNLNIKKNSRYRHPQQSDRSVTTDSSHTPNQSESCEVLPGSTLFQSPLSVPPVPISSLNRYCVLPSIGRRNIKNLPQKLNSPIDDQ